MVAIPTGKHRGLQQLADTCGVLAMCAADHRDSLKKMLNPANPDAVTPEQMAEFKVDLCRALGSHASAVLLDPIYGAAQGIAAGVLPGQAGLLVSMEATGYGINEGERLSRLLEGWDVHKAKKMGASAAKLLVYFRPDAGRAIEHQLGLVAALAEECQEADLTLLVEVVTYALEGESPEEFARLKPRLVIESARQVSALPIDVLKIEFPGDLRAEKDEDRFAELCQELDAASRTPWVLLSAGVDFEVFRREVHIACRAGASGFLAGRALWQEATGNSSRAERYKYLATTAARRLDMLTAVADAYGTPWYAKLGSEDGSFAPTSAGWHLSY